MFHPGCIAITQLLATISTTLNPQVLNALQPHFLFSFQPHAQVLAEQASAASGRGEGPPLLPPPSQRRLMRILRELDANALEKLLLWESYFREEAWEGRDSPRVRRLLRRVHAAIKALDEQAVRALAHPLLRLLNFNLMWALQLQRVALGGSGPAGSCSKSFFCDCFTACFHLISRIRLNLFYHMCWWASAAEQECWQMWHAASRVWCTMCVRVFLGWCSLHSVCTALHTTCSAKRAVAQTCCCCCLCFFCCCCHQAAQGQASPFADYPDLPADVPDHQRVDKDMACAHLDAEVVGRQFHRGSGDRHYVRMDSYPAFEGYSLQVRRLRRAALV
jgi:hypothetical protein